MIEVTLRPGTRLKSPVSTTEVVIVKPPSSEVDLRCGGLPMVPLSDTLVVSGHPDPAFSSGTLIGKRYADPVSGLELLCTKPGKGSLSLGAAPLRVKDAKPLPSSD